MKLDWFTVPRQLSSKQFRDYGLTLPESSGCAGMTLLTLLLLSSGRGLRRGLGAPLGLQGDKLRRGRRDGAVHRRVLP